MMIPVTVAAFFALTVIFLYNKLVQGRNLVKNAFAQIDVQLKRRYDLIPNLVESVKAYMKHEKTTLEAVISARNMAFNLSQNLSQNPADGSKMREFLQAESMLSQSLGKFMAIAESYPELRSNQNMIQFQEELTSTENKISFARQAYNDSVMIYNNLREAFPNNLVAGAFGFTVAEVYQVEAPIERQALKVAF